MRPAADFDLIVIGGGLTGASVAREAATRGLKALLLEREDLGAGASAGVEALLHPEGADEVSSLREREHELEVLRGLAPFLLRKTAVLRPTPGPSASLGEKWSARDEEAHRGRSATRLSAEEARGLEPGLAPEVAGALAYDEWCCDLGRLTTLTALSAERHRAELRTHTEVVGLLRQAGGEVEGVLARTGPEAEPLRFTARAVVNAAGAEAGAIAGLARLSLPGLRRRRQVRLVFAERLSRFALALTAIDGRRVLAVPDLGRTAVGFAERELFGTAGDHPADPDEVGALLAPLVAALPSAAEARRLRSEARVVASFARADGSEAAAHLLVDHGAEGARGLFTLVGGPPLLARVRAKLLVDQVCAQLRIDAPSTSHQGSLAASGRGGGADPRAAARGRGLRRARRAPRARDGGDRRARRPPTRARKPALPVCPGDLRRGGARARRGAGADDRRSPAPLRGRPRRVRGRPVPRAGGGARAARARGVSRGALGRARGDRPG